MMGANKWLAQWALPVAAMVLSALLFWQANDAMRETDELSSDHHMTHYSLGEYRWNIGDLEKAEQHFQQAQANKPDMMEAYFSRGQVLRQLGRGDEAIASYERALEIAPDHFESITSLATLLLQAGRAPEACALYERALLKSPLHHATLNNLAWTLATHRDDAVRDGPRALELADRASRQKDDGDPATLVTLAAASAAAGDFERAITALERAVPLATQLGNSRFAEEVRPHFEAYRKRQPLRL